MYDIEVENTTGLSQSTRSNLPIFFVPDRRWENLVSEAISSNPSVTVSFHLKC